MDPTSEYEYYDPDYVPGLFGFHNTGAICWMNSLLQFLLGLPAINKVLIENEDSLSNNALAVEYITFLKSILPNGNRGIKSDEFDPQVLAAASSRILAVFLQRLKTKKINIKMGASEECANEGFVWFIDMLGCPKLEKLLITRYEVSFVCPKCNQDAFRLIDKTYQIELFTRVRIETQDEFTKWLKVHPEEGDTYRCELCGHCVGKFNKMRQLKRMSEIIIVVFNQYQEKTKRWFPQQLSFSRIGGGNLEYKLVGKIEHSGTMNGGHYWAQSLRDGDWAQLNDNAMPCLGNSQPTSETYMIAYHLMPPK
jgi:ubiquitin C-terminal hydrolase